MSWRVPHIWEGADVWIIGGGPSITKLFGIPNSLVQKVLQGSAPLSAYSPYMKVLHDKHVVGINVAYMLGEWVDVVFFGDNGFFLKHKEQLAQFPGLKVCCDPQAQKYPWVKFLERDGNHAKGISPHPQKVSWNHNSGAAAISFVAHTGATRILLLGFDMKLDKEQHQHWHDVYKKGAIDPARKKKLPFDRHLMGFSTIAKDAAKMGIEILNLSPDSAITDFEKVKLEDVL